MKKILITTITILMAISYNVYSQTFVGKLYPDSKDSDKYVVYVYNKTNNILIVYGLDYYSYLISDYKIDIDISIIQLIIKNNKAIYNKQFEYSIYNNDITIKETTDKDSMELTKEANDVVTEYIKEHGIEALSDLHLLLLADSILINDKKMELTYKNYKRTIKPLLEEKNKVSTPAWYFFLKEKLAEIN